METKKMIYLLEDDEGIRELLEFLLTDQGYRVMSFPTIRLFRDQLQLQLPDLMILDIRLPDGDGRILCHELRQEEPTAGLPIVITTAHSEIRQVSGADDFISMPFDIDKFIRRIEILLKQKGRISS